MGMGTSMPEICWGGDDWMVGMDDKWMDGWIEFFVYFLFCLALGRQWEKGCLGVGEVDDVLFLYCMFMCGGYSTRKQ